MEILRCNLITDSLFLLLWSFLPLMDIVMGNFEGFAVKYVLCTSWIMNEFFVFYKDVVL